MAITNIKVSNFKSFKDLDLNLGRFNVVIGANASGKSNFVEIFRFLKTIEQNNLEDAISLQGGTDSVLNKRLCFSEPLRVNVTSDREMPWGGGWASIRVYETTYGFSLDVGTSRREMLVEDEQLTQRLRTGTSDEDVRLNVDILLSGGKRRVEIGPQEVVDRITNKSTFLDYGPLFTLYHHIRGLGNVIQMSSANALLIRSNFSGLIGPFDSLFEQVGIYDIDPHAVKRPHEKAGRISLDRNGGNLVLVLKSILADSEKSRKFHNLLRYMLPFAVEVAVEDYLGMSLLLKLREQYYEESLLANLLSDGTADVVALIVALFFEDKDVVIIEEPERNIHPRLISGLVELMKDAARTKQVIVTTHSPEFVKHAGLESLLLISRDKEGFSTISRPAEKETVKIFLQNDLGLDDLFVQDVLAAP